MMKNILSTALILTSLTLGVTHAQMAETEAATPATPTYERALFVIHPTTGTILANVSGTVPKGPASLTKLMTLYLVFEALQDGKITLESTLPVSEKAWRTEGSKMFIEVGKAIRVEDLIRGIAIVSGNDATVTVAEYLGGTEDGFAAMMNQKAKDLGLTGSTFTNASGLPNPAQVTTARDVALLITALFRDFPEYRQYLSEQEFVYNGIKQHNRNRLLSMNVGIDACKTGHTSESGYHLASTAVQGGERLVVVTMGNDDFNGREGATMQAYRTFFAQNRTVTVAKAGSVVVPNVPVWQGTQGMVSLTVAEDFAAFLNPTQTAGTTLTATYKQPLIAPLAADAPVGELTLTLPSGQVLTTALVPAQAVPQAGFMGRLLQTLGHKLGL